MSWFVVAVKKYAVFEGRARRKEYWFFVLFYIIFSLVLGLVDGLAGTVLEGTNVGLLGTLYGFALLVPSLAVSVRRLHDTGRSGWWLLINLIPLIGFIVFLVFAVQDSQPGENRFGANPKEIGEG